MAIDKTVLPAKINAFVAGKLQGKTAADRAIYTSQDPYFNGLGRFIRNPNCWLNGVKNISCFSPAQMSGANWWQRGGTLITRKHVLFAAHFAPGIITGGTPLIFVADDNTVIRRNITAYGLGANDLAIAVLNNPVPENIKIAKVFPSNFAEYFAGTPRTGGGVTFNPPLYAVGLDQEEKATLKIWINEFRYGSGAPSTGATVVNLADMSAAGYSTMVPSPTSFADFFEQIITGDSGNPAFAIVNNELVVLTTWWGPTTGPFPTGQYAAINGIIESLSPGEGYALTDIDLADAYENMPKRYLNPAGSGDPGTLANWYQDAALTVPAIALPTGSDVPVLPWAKSAARSVGGSGVLSAL